MFCIAVAAVCITNSEITTIHCFLSVYQGVTLSSVISVSEEHRLGVFENNEQVKIFGPRGQEVTGNWRQLHSDRELETTAQ